MNDNFKTSCKNPAYKNRLGRITYDNTTLNGSDNLTSIEFVDSCYSNGNIIGDTSSRSVTVKTLGNFSLVDKTLSAEIGTKYDDTTTEYIPVGTFTITSQTDAKTSQNGEYKGIDNLRLLDKKYTCGIATDSLATCTISDFYSDVCTQLGLTPVTTTFLNSTIVVGGNPFTNGETCRDVIRNVAQTACGFVKIDLSTSHIDIKWFDTTTAETFTKSDYSTLTKNQVYGPVNCLVIDDGVVNGENVTRQDDTSITTNGETQIKISGNYFLNTEAKRTEAIDNIWNQVKGFTYVDCEITCYTGKPYLEKGNKISVQDSDGTYFDTYVLYHDFTYDGTFKSIIKSQSLTKAVTNTKNTQTVTSYFKQVERSVNKIDGEISDVIDQVTKDGEKVSTMEQTVDGFTNKVDSLSTVVSNNYSAIQDKFGNYATNSDLVNLQNTVTTLQTDTYTKTEINTKLTDGSVSKVVSTNFTFDQNGMETSKTGAKADILLGYQTDNGDIKKEGLLLTDKTSSLNSELLFAGYDKSLLQMLVRVANLYLTQYLVLSDWRIEIVNDTEQGEGLGFFYIGN